MKTLAIRVLVKEADPGQTYSLVSSEGGDQATDWGAVGLATDPLQAGETLELQKHSCLAPDAVWRLLLLFHLPNLTLVSLQINPNLESDREGNSESILPS